RGRVERPVGGPCRLSLPRRRRLPPRRRRAPLRPREHRRGLLHSVRRPRPVPGTRRAAHRQSGLQPGARAAGARRAPAAYGAVMSLRVFLTVYGVIFLAELPDKTALAALALATRHRALPVFLGAAAALAVQSAVAVAAGTLLARLPVHVVHVGAGVLFILFAVVMWVRKHEDGGPEREPSATGFWRPLWTVFVVVFVAELGDLTQIGTATLQAKYGEWL